MHMIIFIGDYKPILKIQSATVYKEEGEIHCNSQCHVVCTKNFKSHLPGPASFNVAHSNVAAWWHYSAHIKRLRDLVNKYHFSYGCTP
jgi:hypothetical protein